MTLKELLLKCDFDDVLRHIGEIEERQLDMASHYKEVFDRLRLIDAIPNDGKIEVSVGEQVSDEQIPVEVYGMHDSDDAELLGQQIDINRELSIDVLCANCLYEYTYYGFDDEDMDEFFGYRSRQPTRHDKIERLIQRLTANPSEPCIKRKDVCFLFDTESLDDERYHSFTNDTSCRAAYIKELIEKYSHADYSDSDHFVILITTSSEYPLYMHELELITDILPSDDSVTKILGCSIDEKYGKEMSVRIVRTKIG